MDLVVQGLDLLLRSRRKQKVVHLSSQNVINIDIKEGSLLCPCRGVQEGVLSLVDLGKLCLVCLKYLLQEGVAVDKLFLMVVLQLVGLDVLPQGRDDDSHGLRVQTQ